MAEHHGVDLRQVNSQLLRIVKRSLRGAEVHQKLMFGSLHIKGQTMNIRTSIMPFRIFNQINNSHTILISAVPFLLLSAAVTVTTPSFPARTIASARP